MCEGKGDPGGWGALAEREPAWGTAPQVASEEPCPGRAAGRCHQARGVRGRPASPGRWNPAAPGKPACGSWLVAQPLAGRGAARRPPDNLKVENWLGPIVAQCVRCVQSRRRYVRNRDPRTGDRISGLAVLGPNPIRH